MIHKTLLKVASCSVGGTYLAMLVTYVILWNEHLNYVEEHNQVFREGMVAFDFLEFLGSGLNAYETKEVLWSMIIGAIIGLIGGIGWSIKHNEARWRFIGWTVAGGVVALAIGGYAENNWFMLPGVLGAVIGGITALESAGYFNKKGGSR